MKITTGLIKKYFDSSLTRKEFAIRHSVDPSDLLRFCKNNNIKIPKKRLIKNKEGIGHNIPKGKVGITSYHHKWTKKSRSDRWYVEVYSNDFSIKEEIIYQLITNNVKHYDIRSLRKVRDAKWKVRCVFKENEIEYIKWLLSDYYIRMVGGTNFTQNPSDSVLSENIIHAKFNKFPTEIYSRLKPSVSTSFPFGKRT